MELAYDHVQCWGLVLAVLDPAATLWTYNQMEFAKFIVL